MSKQSEAKERQQYVAKAIPKTCMNCVNFFSDKVQTSYGYVQEKNMRCELGKFAVKKMGTCTHFLGKNK